MHYIYHPLLSPVKNEHIALGYSVFQTLFPPPLSPPTNYQTEGSGAILIRAGVGLGLGPRLLVTRLQIVSPTFSTALLTASTLATLSASLISSESRGRSWLRRRDSSSSSFCSISSLSVARTPSQSRVTHSTALASVQQELQSSHGCQQA